MVNFEQSSNYIQLDKHHTVNHTLNIKAVNKYRNKSESKEEKEPVELDFGSTSLKLHEEDLDVYGGIQSEIVNTMIFNENLDLSMTYLGRLNKTTNDKLKAVDSFLISEHVYTLGKLLDGTECQLLLDTGASKSFMSKSFYMRCKLLYSLPKFASKTQRIQVGNGQCVSVLIIIPVIIDVHGHRFEIYMLVSEIHQKLCLSLRYKECIQVRGCNNF